MSKHNGNSVRKVIKQLKKCADITRIDKNAKGYMIYAKGIKEGYDIHTGSNCYHPLRRWLKEFTSLKNLKF